MAEDEEGVEDECRQGTVVVLDDSILDKKRNTWAKLLSSIPPTSVLVRSFRSVGCSRTMTTIPDTLPSGIPDFSEAKDFEDEADARVFNEEDEPTSPHDTDNLPPEFRGLEERLQEMRRAPRKPTASTPKEKVDGEEDEPLKALYFVRIPRADTDSPTYDLLQQEFEAQLAQVKIYVEERRVQTVSSQVVFLRRFTRCSSFADEEKRGSKGHEQGAGLSQGGKRSSE